MPYLSLKYFSFCYLAPLVSNIGQTRDSLSLIQLTLNFPHKLLSSSDPCLPHFVSEPHTPVDLIPSFSPMQYLKS
jgi:hypothetical protein